MGLAEKQTAHGQRRSRAESRPEGHGRIARDHQCSRRLRYVFPRVEGAGYAYLS